MLRRTSLPLVAAVVLAGCGGSATPAPATPAPAPAAICNRAVDASSADAYAASFVRLLGCEVPGAKAHVTAALAVRIDHGGKTFDVSLERPWRGCQSEPAACTRWLTEHVRGTAEVLQPPLLTAAALRLAVRSKHDIEAFVAAGTAVTSVPLVADLVVVAVIDTPATIKYLTAEDLTALALSRDDATAQARRNVAAALGPLASVIKDLPPNGLGMLYREDPYEASRLLAHDEWRPVAERFGGELLVAAPARDLILYVDGRPPLARTTLAAVAADVYGKADRPLSPAVLRWTATGWVVAP